MTISEAMDVVRALCGKPDVDPVLLRFAMDEGRREIERKGNYYWMASIVSKALVTSQSSYAILTSGSNGFNLSSFKAVRYVFQRATSGGTTWILLPVGSHAAALAGASTTATGPAESGV